MLETTRDLDGQSEKRRSVDFALWKKAFPEHIIRWNRRGYKFSGWHMECSAMEQNTWRNSIFTVEEWTWCSRIMNVKIAQSTAALGKETVHYWMHNNMITIAGQKMGKRWVISSPSKNFSPATYKLLTKAFSPMTIRFFILQAHYRSTVDFSSEALKASERDWNDWWKDTPWLRNSPPEKSTVDVNGLREKCEGHAMIWTRR